MPQNPIFKPLPARRGRREAGTAVLEFVLSTALIIVPLFFGIIVIGLSLILANQVTEVCRDTGHMFAYGVDFSQAASQLLVTQQLAQGLGMTPTGGKGVIYLSILTYVDGSSCTGAGLQANTTNCPNLNQIVVTKRLIIGNTGIHASTFAPGIPSSLISSSGAISSANYLTNASVQAANFAGVINLTAGQYAYVSEMFVNPPLGGIWSLFSSNVVTARSVF
jgi:hypothetical protein